MADLAVLKEKTKHLTVLYVEDSSILLKKMSVFLGKLFKEVYQAEDGQKGFETFQKKKPDIVITDIDMPKMNGHELIEEIKKVDPEASIIIYSAYATSENLLQSIHAGVVDFIPKPVDINLFEKVLTKVVEQQMAKEKNTANRNSLRASKAEKKEVVNIDQAETDEIFTQLEVIHRSKRKVEFLNHYRGVPIYDKGLIHCIEFNTITVNVPFLQSRMVKYESGTVLISDLLENTIEADLEKFNSFNNTIVLKNLRYLQDKSKRRKVICVEPNSDFTCLVKYKGTTLHSNVSLLAEDFITLYLDLDEDMERMEEGDQLVLKMLIEKTIDKNHSVTTSIDLKGELYFMSELDNNNVKLMLLLDIDREQKEILSEYITLRRKELIVEFKHIKD